MDEKGSSSPMKERGRREGTGVGGGAGSGEWEYDGGERTRADLGLNPGSAE